MSGKTNYTNRLPQVRAQNVIPVYTEADMGTPVGGVITLVGGTTYEIMVDDFTTANRFDVSNSGLGNTIVITSSQLSRNRFVSTGDGDALFFNIDTGPGVSVKFVNVTVFNSSGTRAFLDISAETQRFGLCQITSSVISDFSIGISVVKNAVLLITNLSRWINSRTITLIDAIALASEFPIVNFPVETLDPAFSISSESPTVGSQITLDQCGMLQRGLVIHSNLNSFSTVLLDGLFIDPFSTTPLPFFFDATGTVTAVADGSGGKIECTAAGHNILNGDTVTHDTDFTDVNYQGDFVASEVVEGTSYKVIALFTATDTGTWTNKSLNQKDPKVISRASEKIDVANSMTLAEGATNGQLTVDGLTGTAVAVVSVSPDPGDWIEDPASERLSIDTTTGLITYNGLIDIAVELRYQVIAIELSSPSQELIFHLHINGVQQTKTKVDIDTAATNSGFYIGGIFNLSPTDTIQLFKLNTTNAVNTLVEATILALAI